MNHLIQSLGELRDAHLLRRRSTCEAIDATHVLYNDQPCLLLAGNSYLGLTHHPAVQNAAAAAALQYGTGSGGSRLTTGSHALYGALEEQLASFKHSEDALVFSSGYAANGLTTAPNKPANETWDAYWARVWAPRPAVAMATGVLRLIMAQGLLAGRCGRRVVRFDLALGKLNEIASMQRWNLAPGKG